MNHYTGPVSVFSGFGNTVGLGALVRLGQDVVAPPAPVVSDSPTPAPGGAASPAVRELATMSPGLATTGVLMAMAGSAAGGALTGWVAAGHGRGALTGAAFTGGFAGISYAIALGMAGRKGLAALAGAVGVAGLIWTAYRVFRRGGGRFGRGLPAR